MKIVQVNTYDVQGGAARAAYRLHQGLLQIGQDSTLLSRFKVSDDPSVEQIVSRDAEDFRQISLASIQAQYINENRTSLSNTLFSLPYPGYDLSQTQPIQQADIINLHWVALFQSPRTLKQLLELNKPIVWTLHDMWAMTGGCHYSAGCQKFEQNCAQCPQLADDPHNLAAAILQDKLDCLTEGNLTIVTPSQWLGDCARRSQLFRQRRVEVIPYSLEVEDIFTPIEKSAAKQAVGVHPETTTLLFGAASASEDRKGFAELVQAIRHCLEHEKFRYLAQTGQIQILCFGYASELIHELQVPVKSLGAIDSDFRLNQIYSAADLFILPSLEDNLPNTMLEAMSCGTPVVAFATGGIPDLVQDGVTGRLAPLRDTQRLAAAILDLLFDPMQRQQMGQAGRRLMESEFPIAIQAQRYLSLYQDLLQERSSALCSSPSPAPSGGTMSGAEPNTIAVPLDAAPAHGFAPIADTVAFKAMAAQLKQTQTHLQQLKQDYQQAQSRLQEVEPRFQQAEATLQQTQTELFAAKDAATLASAALAGEQQVSDQLRQELKTAEVARAKLIHDLRHMNEHLQHQLHHDKEHRIRELEQSVRHWRQETDHWQRESQHWVRSTEHLEREIAYLSTGRAAIRQLIKTSLRKLGLFDLIYNNHQLVVPLYNLFLRDKWKPATLQAGVASQPESAAPPPSPPPVASPDLKTPEAKPDLEALPPPRSIDMEATEIETLVLARSLGVDLNSDQLTATLAFLQEFTDETKQVLCLTPAAPLLPLLQSLAKRGATVTCIGCAATDKGTLESYGLQAIEQDLGRWMIATDRTHLHEYDAICIDKTTPKSALLLLQGRLAAHTKLVINGQISKQFEF